MQSQPQPAAGKATYDPNASPNTQAQPLPSKASYDPAAQVQPGSSSSTYEESPPSFADAVSGTEANQSGKVPLPDYYDISIIPQENLLLRQNVQPMTASTAKFERTTEGVQSTDPILQENPDELFRFFLTHLIEKPGMSVHVQGTHQESHTVTETTTNSDGSTSTSTRTETRTVTDFTYYINADGYILPDWTAVFALPKKGATSQTQNVRAIGAHMPEYSVPPGQFREALEEFTRSKNLLKEIQMEKEIPWDYNSLRMSITTAVRLTGYWGSVSVTFPRKNYKMAVFSSSAISEISRSCVTWVFLALTCLWIIFLPLYFILRKAVKGRLAAHYPIGIDVPTFYQRNINNIVMLARRRAFGTVVQAL
ncbi:hypothetical protein HDU97_006179 [Phlyctochytrium planicorne]|nr:hypothetical protein HDU97_006179 [Phlyctochytrium planicorne]